MQKGSPCATVRYLTRVLVCFYYSYITGVMNTPVGNYIYIQIAKIVFLFKFGGKCSEIGINKQVMTQGKPPFYPNIP